MFFEGTAAARIPLNDEKFGMLYGNLINIVMRGFEDYEILCCNLSCLSADQ